MNYKEILDAPLDVSEDIKDKEYAASKLNELLIDSVSSKVNVDKIGVAFSGGVDSSLIALICSKLNKDFVLYTSGLEDCQDIRSAKETASRMNWKLKVNSFTREQAAEVIKKVHEILPEGDFLKVGIACPLYGALELAEKDGIKMVLTGLGADSIFAGFDRYKKLKEDEVSEECLRGINNLWGNDISRDNAIAKHFGIELAFPFVDRWILRFAMQLHPSLKIDYKMNKIVLREVAVKLGLNEEFAFRKKTAAQYGSKFDRTILKLAWSKGFEKKNDYVKSL